MEKQKAILFINWTAEDFSYPWGSVEYTFRAGSTTYLDEGLAAHFAKHLANREINKLGKLMSDPLVKIFIAKCYGEEEIVAADEKSLQVKLTNTIESKPQTAVVKSKKFCEFCEFCDAKGPIKHRATCPTLQKPKEEIKTPAKPAESGTDEKDFEGLE